MSRPAALRWISLALLVGVGAACGRSPTFIPEEQLDACEVDPRGASAGCSFTFNRVLSISPQVPDALWISNPGDERTMVQLVEVPGDAVTERNVTEPMPLDPGWTIQLDLDMSYIPGDSSGRRVGGVYRLQAESPVSATLVASGVMDRGNDSTLLLPDASLGRRYVVASYSPHEEQIDEQFGMQGEPSFFEVVGLAEQTTVRFSPPVFPRSVITAGASGGPGAFGIPEGSPGSSATLTLQRHEVARVVAAKVSPEADHRDVSGTVIETSEPARVVGGGRCARVPVRQVPPRGGCDPIQEQMIPVSGWGQRYVLAPAPQRNREQYHWRVYAGADLVTVEARPGLPQEPELSEPIAVGPTGGWVELRVSDHEPFILEGDGPFLPVQYLQSHQVAGEGSGTDAGDPAMIQVAPVDRFDTRYSVVVPTGWSQNYLQIIKRSGSDVRLNGALVRDGTPVAEFEVVDLGVDAGVYELTGDEPFGVNQFGWASGLESECPLTRLDEKCHTSYAHLGGLGPRP